MNGVSIGTAGAGHMGASGGSMTCAKCGVRITSATVINGMTVCDWCIPKAPNVSRPTC